MLKSGVFTLVLLSVLSTASHAASGTSPFLGPSTSLAEDANVFGRDDRVRLTEMTGPLRQIGRLVLPGGSACSATLVGKDLILSAAHCAIDEKTKKYVDGSYTFEAGYRNGTSLATATVTRLWWGTSDPIQFRGHDWLLGRLDQPLGDTLGWMGVDRTQSWDVVGNRLTLSSYSADIEDGEIASSSSCSPKVSPWSPDMLLHDCDSTRGSSGGAMYVVRPNGGFIRAIQSAEFRKGGDKSLIGIPYADQAANIAIPTSNFIDKLIELKKTR